MSDISVESELIGYCKARTLKKLAIQLYKKVRMYNETRSIRILVFPLD